LKAAKKMYKIFLKGKKCLCRFAEVLNSQKEQKKVGPQTSITQIAIFAEGPLIYNQWQNLVFEGEQLRKIHTCL
jgi:hypothetical protein